MQIKEKKGKKQKAKSLTGSRKKGKKQKSDYCFKKDVLLIEPLGFGKTT